MHIVGTGPSKVRRARRRDFFSRMAIRGLPPLRAVRSTTLPLIAVLLAGLFGCGSEHPAGEGASDRPDASDAGLDHPYSIVTTTGMVTDLVRNVAGSHAEVTGIMGEGVDPHLYKPTRTDIVRVKEADVVFYSGLLLEGLMTDLFIKAAREGQRIHAVTELIDESYLLAPDEFAGHWDPHVWMDVSAWSQCVDVVRDALTEIDPEHADDYRANAEAYLAQLDELDAYARKTISSIPESRRVLVTAHDAFNYFGRAYDIDVVGIQGISTESEAGLNDINRLIDLVVEREIPAVFVESSVSDKNVRALVEGANSRGWSITVGGELFSDAMGPTGTYEGAYVGMIDHNVTTIARALGGEAPARGMNGKLQPPGENGHGGRPTR